MDAKQAQRYIDSLEKYVPPTKEDLQKISHLKVDYNSVEEMPKYVQDKINFCVEYITAKYDPEYIDLVMSYVNGYPIDERTSVDDFNLKKEILNKAKLSDFDFIVPSIDAFQKIEIIAPLIKIDMFKLHHGGVKKIRVYENVELL